MTNSEKARELGNQNARQYRHNYGGDELVFSDEECKQSALEMAEWKDQQHAKECESLVGLAVKEARQVFIDRACEWLKDQMHIGSPEKTGNIYATTFLSVTPDFLGEFRKAMTEYEYNE